MAPPIVNDVLGSAGSPLDTDTRRYMEPRFAHDFSGVRVHTDTRAAESANAVNALAYTVGDSMVFGANRYRPGTMEGKRLLAHELAHVVQQRGAPPETVQRAPRNDDPIHAPLLDTYSQETGMPRDTANQHTENYEGWLETKPLADELQKLIDGAVWKEIRKRVYPKESAPGIQRAKDRHAGKLPDLTGLGRLTTLDRFATAVRGIQSRWATLGTPDNRVKELGRAANTELAAADVPAYLAVDKKLMEIKAFFQPSTWMFVISQDLVSASTLNDRDAAEVANTTLHEGRHAEQNFLAARFSAGGNGKDAAAKDAAAIVLEQGIPLVIAGKAVAKKFDASTDKGTKDLGRRMFQATVTDGVANQAISDDDGWALMATMRSDAISALMKLRIKPGAATIADAEAKRDALKAQIKVVEDKYTLYRRIPYEADAHEVGDAAEQAFLGWK